ncbi:MAG TPA: hypothetical protein DCZ95_13180 [Verrucomicrobia bacterium]|nr:MAG: hypothetical protein A2X46_11495 [Lentisphaerae bacterium GWF2_57_35]HBA85039.1 hypothetical protein [Verrucomicrobiota bacterium]
MAYGIGLTLDDMLDAKVREIWRQFEAARIGKTPGQFDEPPHITFSVFPLGNPSTLIELVDATPITDTKIRLIPFGAFLGEKRVLYYNVVLSPGLMEAHLKHFTMAVDIDAEDFGRGVEI